MASATPREQHDAYSVPFGANEIRLSLREWAVAATLSVTLLATLPLLWSRFESLGVAPATGARSARDGLIELAEYRVPFDLSEDYWMYTRMLDQTSQTDTVLIGDSVVWGEFVSPKQTLSAALSDRVRSRTFVNGGLSGSHPLALEGLVRWHARSICDREVILHLNPLWLSSPERDLRTSDDTTFNHPDLIPQFWPRIPAYGATADQRIGRLLDRYQPHRQLAAHLRDAWFGGSDIPTWALEHPSESILGEISWQLPRPSMRPRHVGPRSETGEPPSWESAGIPPQDLPWVELESSLQWQAFLRTIDVLESRGNRLLIVVGPFNEHLLTPASRDRLRRLLSRVESQLAANGNAFLSPPVLASPLYGDASHPLRAGYAQLADEIQEAMAEDD